MSIYKECDIRGLYGKELDDNSALLIGKSVGTLLRDKKVVVGGDTRNSTEALRKMIIKGLVSCGCQVTDLGTIPTPLFYFGKNLLGGDGGIMVTASHNPADYNGFKISLGEKPVNPEEIQNIQKLVNGGKFSEGRGSFIRKNIEQKYIDHVIGLLPEQKNLKVVIDCCNGAASEIAPRIFEEMGYEVIKLYCSFEGSFPNRNPNPSAENNLKDLKAKVIAEKADMGIAFDGDGDRVVFVDDKGRYCEGEKSFVLLLEYYLKNNKSTVVYDGKSSSIIKKTVERFGSRAVMERSGHAFIKKTFLETDSVLAGEVSGHFYFQELGFDDGIYASLKMAEILGGSDKSMSDLIDNIEHMVISPDIRISMSLKRADSILEKLTEFGRDYEISFLDGVRIDFPRAWILVRKSVTEPCITIRLEADTAGEAKRISQQIFTDEYTDIHQVISSNLNCLQT